MSPPRVLLVDDEEDIRLVARVALTRTAGWTVLVATSGAEALEKAAAEQPDAIVMDVMMPGMDGPTVLARLRADPATAGIPVVFMTAKGQPAELERLAALGAVGIVGKPFDPMTLADDLRRTLGWA